MSEKPADVYFDDVVVDSECWSSAITLDLQDMTAFARQWDPLPIHLDDAAARAAGFEGITASGTHLLAVKNRLLYDFGLERTVIASFGFDEVRFKAPARAGDTVRVRLRWFEKRLSKSRPGSGIARHFCELTRQDGVVLLSLYDTVMIATRPES